MPNVDLMGVFNAEYPGSPENLEQRSFYFDQSPDVYFVDDQERIVENYNSLPNVRLTIEEQALLTKQPEPRLNEPQVLVKAIKYENGKIFVQACKCDYKFLVAYGSGKVFPVGSPIYQQAFFKTGSIASLVTSDEKTVIVERNDAWKLFSSFAGFLKPQSVEEKNVAIATAVEESKEEFFQYTNIKLQEVGIGALSFRKGNITGKFGTAEFIVTIRADCTADELIQALDKNLTKAKKPDGAPDHTGRYKVIDPRNMLEQDFDIKEENGSSKKIRDISYFLVDPVIITVCKFFGVEVPNFMQKPSLNEMIAARQVQEVQQQPKEEGWCAYLQRRASECFSRSHAEHEL